MRLYNRNITVYANPYAALDGFGNPAGACPCDPHEHTPERKWVGAWIAETIIHDKKEAGDLRTPRQDTFFEFSKEQILVPKTAYYLDRLRDGDLIAGDAETAAAAGLVFVDPAKALKAAKQKAIAKWETLYGKGTCPLSQEIETKEESKK